MDSLSLAHNSSGLLCSIKNFFCKKSNKASPLYAGNYLCILDWGEENGYLAEIFGAW